MPGDDISRGPMHRRVCSGCQHVGHSTRTYPTANREVTHLAVEEIRKAARDALAGSVTDNNQIHQEINEMLDEDDENQIESDVDDNDIPDLAEIDENREAVANNE